MVNNTSGTETDGVLKYFMATAIKWVNHTFICISVEEGGTKNEWSNETDLVCFRTYSKGIGENIFYSNHSSKANLLYLSLKFRSELQIFWIERCFWRMIKQLLCGRILYEIKRTNKVLPNISIQFLLLVQWPLAQMFPISSLQRIPNFLCIHLPYRMCVRDLQ